MTGKSLTLLAVLAVAAASAAPADAQLAISANDNKAVLVNGAATIVENPAPDTVSIIDLSAKPPKLVVEIDVPTSVVGPPLSVAITPDEGLALVTAAVKIDPNDKTKTVPDNKVSVIDLKATPPKVIATLEAGLSPAGLSINRQGTLALVANRAEGTVSVFTISGKTVTPAGKVTVGDTKSGVSHVAITPDGKMALVSRDGDDRISVLKIDGTKVEYTKRDMYAGLRPYGLDIASTGTIAAVANIGRGQGDSDTVRTAS
jgi:DNA-binding beta-propeller fold protein YncE